MAELLQEFMNSRGVSLRIDRERGVIQGVKILGLESRNGRSYLPAALQAARSLYEGAKVNVNHPKGAAAQTRDYQDRLGTIRQVEWRAGEGLFGELVFNPKHALAEQLLWDAEHAPENLGLSHNVEARVARQGERLVVEAITRVQSVDLVADPATTRGLFETTAPVEPVTESVWRERVEQLQLQVSRLEKQQLARRLLSESRLPQPEATDSASQAMVSTTFWESLLAAPDELTMRDLILERQRLVGSVKHWLSPGAATVAPQSREAALVEHDAFGSTDARAFARSISGV